MKSKMLLKYAFCIFTLLFPTLFIVKHVTTNPTPENTTTLWDTPSDDNIESRLREVGIIPYVFPIFPQSPKHFLKVTFKVASTEFNIQGLTDGIYFNDSVLTEKPCQIEYQYNDTNNYTLFFTFINKTNQDIPEPESLANHKQYQHWVVYNIPGNDWQNGIEYLKYEKPPPMLQKEYRLFVFLLFRQKRELFIDLDDLRNQTYIHEIRSIFRVFDFVKKYDLDRMHAANYFHQKISNQSLDIQ